MEHIFQSVLLLSAAGSALAGILLLFKPLTKRIFSSRWQYYIWLAVLVVMVLPVRFRIPAAHPANATLSHTEAQLPQGQAQQATQAAPAPKEAAEMQTRTEDVRTGAQSALFRRLLAITWAVGASVFFICGLLSYWRFLYIIRRHAAETVGPELDNAKAETHVRQSVVVKTTGMLTAPLLAGLFKPVLLLPAKKLDTKELHYILCHELTHLKRRDLWYKWFAMLVNAVHWFNPLMYLVTKQINEECEISCDLSVTQHLNEDGKKEYMNTIIRLASVQKGGKASV